MSALPQHDERVSCLSCRFSYPAVRGYCPMCGTPAPAHEQVVPGPRPVESKATRETNASPAQGLPSSLRQMLGKPLVVAAGLLAVACGLFFWRARSAGSAEIITPAPVIAAAPPDPVARSAPAPEKVAVQPVPVSQEPAAAAHEARPVSPTDDPAELWNRVREGNTDAEVTLAKWYLDGHGVTQNCEQARLLLLAAAKRRSRAADQVLYHLYPQRCP